MTAYRDRLKNRRTPVVEGKAQPQSHHRTRARANTRTRARARTDEPVKRKPGRPGRTRHEPQHPRHRLIVIAAALVLALLFGFNITE